MNTTLNETNPKIVVSDLQSYFDRAMIAMHPNMEVNFYERVAFYGNFIRLNPLAKEALIPLFTEAKEAARNYKKAYEDFYSLWKKLSLELVKIAEKNNIKDNTNNPLEANNIALIKDYTAKHNIPCFYDDNDSLYQIYSELADKVEKVDKENPILKEHLKVVKSIDSVTNKIVETQVPLLWEKNLITRNEWTHFEKIRRPSVWWAHYNIVRFTNGYYGYEGGGHYFSEDSIVDSFYRSELNDIAHGNKPAGVVVKMDAVGNYLTTLQSYLIPRIGEICANLSQLDNEPFKTRAVNVLEYDGINLDLDRGLLSYRDLQEIDISKELQTQPGKFLKLLIERQGAIVPYSEIARELDINSYNEHDVSNLDLDNDTIKTRICDIRSKQLKPFLLPFMLDERVVSVPKLGYKII